MGADGPPPRQSISGLPAALNTRMAATSIGFSTHGHLTGHSTLQGKELAVRDLRNHFATRRGERVGRPDFGSRLPELLFEPIRGETDAGALEEDIEDEVLRVIGSDPRWEAVSHSVRREGHSVTVDVEAVYVPDGSMERIGSVGSEAGA